MSGKNLTPDQIKAMAEAMGHRVAAERLGALTDGVNRLLSSLEALDGLDLEGLERAETLDLLNLKPEDFPAG